MLSLPHRVPGITHPLIREVYLKKNFGSDHRSEDVLVIDTRSSTQNGHKAFDAYLEEILEDIEDIKVQAEQKIGSFDRIDIRVH